MYAVQALLDEWRAETARKPLAMSEGQACSVLGLSPGPDGVVSEDDLKSAYRSLARKCASAPAFLLLGSSTHAVLHWVMLTYEKESPAEAAEFFV